MADLKITIGADISQYKAGMQEAGNVAKTASNEISQNLAQAAKETENLGGAALSASMKFQQMRSGISAARDGVLAFTVGGQAAERSLLAMGHHINSLVNETGSFKGAIAALGTSLWGTGGIILGLSVAAELFMNYEKSQKKAAETQTDFQKAVESSNKTSTEEISKLDGLYGAATNLNIPMSQRLEAVRKLQEEFPAYFGNLSKEAILAGQAASAYNNLSNAIINQAVIKAGQEKLGESIKPLVDMITEQRRLQGDIDKINRGKKPGETKAVVNSLFLDDDANKLQTYNDKLKDVNDTVKEARLSFQDLVKDLGINALVDPDKLKKEKDAKGPYAELEEQVKKAKAALDDAAADNKPAAFLTELATKLANLQDKLKTVNEEIKNAGFAGGGAKLLPTDTFAGGRRNFGGLIDNGGLAGDSGVPGGLETAGQRGFINEDTDKTVADMKRLVEAHRQNNDALLDSYYAQKKYNAEVKLGNEEIRLFGSGLEGVFENALNGTQSFVHGMIQYLEQLIVKFIAAAAAAEVLNLVTDGGSSGFFKIFGSLSGLGGIGGAASTGAGTAVGAASGSVLGAADFAPRSNSLTNGSIVGQVSGANLQLVYHRSVIQKDRLF